MWLRKLWASHLRCQRAKLEYFIRHDYVNCNFPLTSISVKPPDVSFCRGSRHVTISDSGGYIASETTRETWCGTPENPWLIEALPGQRVNISLVDFGNRLSKLPEYNLDYQSIEVCEKYATILEQIPHKEKTVCGGKARHEHIYLSNGNSVEIQIETRKYDPNYFLFKYESK